MPRLSLGWTGDVWEVAFEIAATKCLDFKLVTIDHGCGIFQVNDPPAQLVDLNDTIADKTFGYLYENITIYRRRLGTKRSRGSTTGLRRDHRQTPAVTGAGPCRLLN
jgi:hypothetical protein